MKSFFDKAIEQVFQAIQSVIVLAAASGHVVKATKNRNVLLSLSVWRLCGRLHCNPHGKFKNSSLLALAALLLCCRSPLPIPLSRFHFLLALLTLFFTLQQAANETD